MKNLEYIIVDGCTVDKNLYIEGLKLSSEIKCLLCDSDEYNKLRIDCKDLISIYCNNCNFIIKQLKKKYQEIVYKRPLFPSQRKLRDYNIGDVIYIGHERVTIKGFDVSGDKEFWIIYELNDNEYLINIRFMDVLKKWEYDYFISNPDHLKRYEDILLHECLNSFAKSMGGQVYSFTKDEFLNSDIILDKDREKNMIKKDI